VVLCRDVLVRIINARIDLHETGHRSKNLLDLLLVTPRGGELGQLAQVVQGVIDKGVRHLRVRKEEVARKEGLPLGLDILGVNDGHGQ